MAACVSRCASHDGCSSGTEICASWWVFADGCDLEDCLLEGQVDTDPRGPDACSLEPLVVGSGAARALVTGIRSCSFEATSPRTHVSEARHTACCDDGALDDGCEATEGVRRHEPDGPALLRSSMPDADESRLAGNS